MGYSKKIVCLANSKKPGGRCVAGKEVLADGFGAWIRPVSARPSAEISSEERSYENGQDIRVFDVIRIPMLAPVPKLHQTENHMIEAQYYWEKTGEMNGENMEQLADDPVTLWTNGDSTYHGTNDRVEQSAAAHHCNSLYLIQPEHVNVRVFAPGADFGNPKRAARASFEYKGIDYDLKVTDPIAEQMLLAKPNGEYAMDGAYFCVSLAEAHTDGYCYKLVATIITNH